MNDPATAPQSASLTLVTAIVSTAASGAESGALDAAIELGIGYGGRTAADELPPIYASRMRGVNERGMAVRLNVQDSDGTLIVSFAWPLSGRSKHAGDQCKAQRKPARHLILPARGKTRIPDSVRTEILQWIDDSHISVLHVVGPGEEQEPGIAEATRDALVWVLEDDHAADTGFAADIDALAASRVDPGRVFDPAAQRQREFAAAAVVLGGILAPPSVSPEVWAERDRLRDLASSVGATGALTTERRAELEASIRQAESEIAATPIDPELLLTLGPCPKCGRPHRPHYCECGHTPESR